MSYFGICILLLISGVVFSDNVCLSPQNPCECILPDKTVIDLSSAGLRGKPRFYSVLFNSSCNEVYYYNPCFAFDSPDKYTTTDSSHKPCAEAAACVKGFGGINGNPPEEHAIGLQRTAIFGKEKEQMYINYTVPGSQKILKVNLNCSNGTSDVHELFMEDSTCSNSSGVIVLTLLSKCACPNGCRKTLPNDSSSGLSTGSKLLIAFFTILLAYLVIGITWNYCNGGHGMELIPNIEFWNDLPTLIMEGVVFTCSCCGRQSSYGEV